MVPPTSDRPPPFPRRGFLAGALRVAAAGLVLPEAASLAGCARAEEEEPPGIVRVDISSLAPGARRVVLDAEIPIELRRTADGVRARSLLCTHQGCVVRWVEPDGQYHCPCHEARFDEHGVPTFGPAQRPLRELPVEIRNLTAYVDVRPPEA